MHCPAAQSIVVRQTGAMPPSMPPSALGSTPPSTPPSVPASDMPPSFTGGVTQSPLQSAPVTGSQLSFGSSMQVNPLGHVMPAKPPHMIPASTALQPSSTWPSQSSSIMLQISMRGTHWARHTPLTHASFIAQSELAMHAFGLVVPPSGGSGTQTPLAHAWPDAHEAFMPQVLLVGGAQTPLTHAKFVGQSIELWHALGCTTHTSRVGSHVEPLGQFIGQLVLLPPSLFIVGGVV